MPPYPTDLQMSQDFSLTELNKLVPGAKTKIPVNLINFTVQIAKQDGFLFNLGNTKDKTAARYQFCAKQSEPVPLDIPLVKFRAVATIDLSNEETGQVSAQNSGKRKLKQDDGDKTVKKTKTDEQLWH